MGKANHLKPIHTGGTACIKTRREPAKNKTSHPDHQWPQDWKTMAANQELTDRTPVFSRGR